MVLRVYQPIAEKTKRHVLISATTERSLAFLINTAPSPFIRGKPDLLRRQVLMEQSTHPFMHHDSYIGCHDTVRLDPIAELALGLCEGTVERLGYVHKTIYELIGSAAAGSKLISVRDSALIATAFPAGP